MYVGNAISKTQNPKIFYVPLTEPMVNLMRLFLSHLDKSLLNGFLKKKKNKF